MSSFAFRSVVLAALAVKPAHATACDSNLMVVLDRSCSMQEPPDMSSVASKWDIALSVLATLTSDDDALNFGLIMFPDEIGAACEQDGPIYVNVGPDQGDDVMAALMATIPGSPCGTSIDTGMAQVLDDVAYQSTVDSEGRRSFVLLLSDGAQAAACGGSAQDTVTVGTIESLYESGHPTFVVGFGGAVDPTSLDSFAIAGGMPRAGSPSYYQADDAEELQAAIDEIAGSVTVDPELGGCVGTPCPDGRCYGEFEVCIEAQCVAFPPDAGLVDAGFSDNGTVDAAALEADPELGSCQCHLRRPNRVPLIPALLLLALAGLSRLT